MAIDNTDFFDEELDLPNFNIEMNIPKENLEKILVIGVGGAGCNAVNYLYTQQDYMAEAGQTVTHYVLNTDKLCLDNMLCENRMVLGENLLKGKGAGANINTGKKATEENRTQIEDLCRGIDLVFIAAGMGGGTGTLGASVVAEIAKSAGAIVVSLVTLPFDYENRKIPAIQGLKALKDSDSLITISNQRIVDYFPDYDFKEGLHESDKILANAISGVIRVIRQPAHVNTDFEDLKTILNNGGRSQILHKSITGDKLRKLKDEPERAIDDIYNEVTESPLITKSDVKNATGILMYIECTHHFTQKLIDMFVNRFSDPYNTASSVDLDFDSILDNLDDIDVNSLETNRPTVIFAYNKLEPKDEAGNLLDEPQLNVTIVATGMDNNKDRQAKAQLSHHDSVTDRKSVV